MTQLSYHYLVYIIKAAPLKDVRVLLKINTQNEIKYMRTGEDNHMSPSRNQIKISNV